MGICFMVYTRAGNCFRMRDDLPSADMCNSSAWAVCKALNLVNDDPESCSGVVEPEKLGALLQRVQQLLQRPSCIEAFARPAYHEPHRPTFSVVEGGGSRRVVRKGQCEMIDFGVDADRITRHLVAIRQVMLVAVEHDLYFGWC